MTESFHTLNRVKLNILFASYLNSLENCTENNEITYLPWNLATLEHMKQFKPKDF